MNSSRPYLLRGLFEWIVANELTPYVVINAEIEEVMVPVEYVEEGRIILNISPAVIQNLFIGDDALEFNAHFGGIEQEVYAPISAVTAIYAKENGRGMVFRDEDDGEDDGGGGNRGRRSGASDNKLKSSQAGVKSRARPRGKPTLTIVK